jgi:hypothetical protein
MLKNLKSYLRNILCISLLLSELTFGQIIFTPFKDNSSYTGAWNLSQAVPNYIAAYMREFHNSQVLSSTAFVSLVEKYSLKNSNYSDLEFLSEIADDYGFRYAASGRVEAFNISRFTAGEPLIAGYEAYSCNIEVFIQIYNLELNTLIYSGNLKGEINDRGLGLSLLGKPTEGKEQFFSLDKIKFGSEEFNITIVGEAMFQLCQMLSEELQTSTRGFIDIPPGERKIIDELADKSLDDINLNTEIKKGEILIYDPDTGEAFINLGSANGLRIGEELSIYTLADSLFDPSSDEFLGLSDKKISELEIIEVRGEKLSLAVVKRNRDKVDVGMEIRKLILKRREN